jgi:hypothetical protein
MSTVVNVTINAINRTASPDPVHVANPDTLLNFFLDYDSIAAGYTFDPAGAISMAIPSTQFIGSWTMPNTLQCTLVDLKTQDGEFHYWVSVMEPPSPSDVAGTPRLPIRIPFDPAIKNNSA